MTKDDLDTVSKFADNAFECSTQFTYKVASRLNKFITFIILWMIGLTIFVLLK